ncbi:MAG: arginine--tRNA ligase [Candidatus Methylacidiphilales bacterium]|nr:arginine--tRNA ligase [Candidatus Methylacidiphilales bacterium]
MASVSLLATLEELLTVWVGRHAPACGKGPWVKACQDERFGHFQTNLAMVAGKSLGINPRELAVQIADFTGQDPRLEKPEIAGPGFVNFRFRLSAIEERTQALWDHPRTGLSTTLHPKTIVVDYSGPNVAKEMHVGHIRSTILGDALSRILAARGHFVIRDNHLGDWGTQFGKMILGYKMAGKPALSPENAVADMQRFYQQTHEACEKDPQLLERARQELAQLQDGDLENVSIWMEFRKLSQSAFDEIYARLGVEFDQTLAESFYNPWLKEVVRDLLDKGVARESQGAVGVFHDPAQPREKSPFLVRNKEEWTDVPMLIQKKDGAALYATTDLATVRYRAEEWKSEAILYVTDGRQQQHFNQLFDVCRRWGYRVEFHHVWFGAVLGADGKPLKTRDGNPIRLRDLLDEAEQRAAAILREKRPGASETDIRAAARIIGIGSLKYADLSQNRNLDYVFDWDKLLAFDGNTAPYLLNAYVRTRSILRKADGPSGKPRFILRETVESDLARRLLAFEDALDSVVQDHRPHLLCAYLYETAVLFHRFFEHCPVLKAENEELKQSRLALCELTGRVLREGLGLLGIGTLEEM